MKYLSLLLFITIVTIYAATTSPYLQAGDSAEMATAAITLGIPHQPSYPLYIAITHAITKLPIPYLLGPRPENILIYRAGLASALFQALAVTYFFLLLYELDCSIQNKKQGKKDLFALSLMLAVTGIYAFSQTIWLYASKPEVFALNNAFVVSLLYYSMRWYNHSSSGRISPRYMLLMGLAFTHHQTVILIFPALIVILLMKKSQIENTPASKIFLRWVSYPFDKKFNKSFPLLFCFFFATIPFFVTLWLLAQRYPFLNWGEISGPVGLVRALIRADYGSIGAYLTNIQNPTVAADQIPFFAQHLATDFSLYVIILAILGTILLYRKHKKIWAIIITLFIISGPLFIMYANFSLEGDFSKATVVRFYFIPEIALVLLCYATLSILYQNIQGLRSNDPNTQIYKKAGSGIFLLLIIALVAQSLYKNKPVFDNLTYSFAKTAIHNTEDNAMILITGDIPNMTMQYMQAVEGERKNRIIFSPGQFHLDWFRKQLKERYPNLKIPAPLPGKQFTSPSQVIDANFGTQPIYIVTDFVDIDPEIQKNYILWPKNLLLKVEKRGVDYKLEPYLDENTKLYESLNLKEFAQLRSKKYQLESPLIFYYSRHFYNLGAVFNSVHKYQEAITQFQRAITIDPEFADAYKALGNIYYFTEDFSPKDPQLASQYLYKYLETTKGTEVEQIIAVQDALKKINDDMKKEQEEEIKAQQEQSKKQIEATASAVSTSSAEVNKQE